MLVYRTTLATEIQHAREIAAGQRFEFGENWSRFLKLLDETRIANAETSLQGMLGAPLSGKTFIDVGSGSGLFSLAARRLGARVHSLDYDPRSVACTAELRRRFFADDPNWKVEHGSALDREYIESLGQFDVVYSWGVLHHTGSMWTALENVSCLVKPGGLLFVSIYNDQGKWSRRWTWIKGFYNRSSKPVKFVLAVWVCVAQWWRRWVKDLLRGRPFASWRAARSYRGMSAWYDVVDWVGGYPFEVAKPEEIFEFYHKRGFVLERMKTQGGDLGCNEFVFIRRGENCAS